MNMTTPPDSDNAMQQGVQPLDAIMEEMKLSNHDLVAVSKEQLTHKTVSKARKGRQLTRRSQRKIIEALNMLRGGREAYRLEDLFTYRGR